MIRKIYFIIILFLSITASAQSIEKTDTSEERIIKEDCGDDNKVFTKVEILPLLRRGTKQKFEDTLSTILKSKNEFKNGTNITFRLLVTIRSYVFDIVKESGNFPGETTLKDILVSYSSMWKPAMQNGRDVCAYVSLQIEISNEVLVVTVKAPFGK